MNMSTSRGKADPNISWFNLTPWQPSPFLNSQSHDQLLACLGFASQLSQNPEVYCKLEVKLGDKVFSFKTRSPGNLPGKRKSLSDYRRDQRRRRSPGKGMPTPGNHGVGSVAYRDYTGTQNEIFSPSFEMAYWIYSGKKKASSNPASHAAHQLK